MPFISAGDNRHSQCCTKAATFMGIIDIAWHNTHITFHQSQLRTYGKLV